MYCNCYNNRELHKTLHELIYNRIKRNASVKIYIFLNPICIKIRIIFIKMQKYCIICTCVYGLFDCGIHGTMGDDKNQTEKRKVCWKINLG